MDLIFLLFLIFLFSFFILVSKLCLFQLVDKTVVLGISKFSHIPVYLISALFYEQKQSF